MTRRQVQCANPKFVHQNRILKTILCFAQENRFFVFVITIVAEAVLSLHNAREI